VSTFTAVPEFNLPACAAPPTIAVDTLPNEPEPIAAHRRAAPPL